MCCIHLFIFLGGKVKEGEQVTLTLPCNWKLKAIASDSTKTGSCLWCQHSKWENTICWFHLWVGSFVRSTEASAHNFKFLCRISVRTSYSIYIRPNAAWRGAAFMSEIGFARRLTRFFFCPLCLRYLSSCSCHGSAVGRGRWRRVSERQSVSAVRDIACTHISRYTFRFPPLSPPLVCCPFLCQCVREKNC